jgi:hypothetical protein
MRQATIAKVRLDAVEAALQRFGSAANRDSKSRFREDGHRREDVVRVLAPRQDLKFATRTKMSLASVSGTGSSNPSPSCAESANHRFLSVGAQSAGGVSCRACLRSSGGLRRARLESNNPVEFPSGLDEFHDRSKCEGHMMGGARLISPVAAPSTPRTGSNQRHGH